MGDVVFLSNDSNDVVKTLEDALADAKKTPRKAVLICTLEDLPDGFNIWMYRAGPLLSTLAMAARLLHRIQQTIDEG